MRMTFKTNHLPLISITTIPWWQQLNYQALSASLIYVGRNIIPQTICCTWVYGWTKCRKTLDLKYVGLGSSLAISSETRTREGTVIIASDHFLPVWQRIDGPVTFIPLSWRSNSTVQCSDMCWNSANGDTILRRRSRGKRRRFSALSTFFSSFLSCPVIPLHFICLSFPSLSFLSLFRPSVQNCTGECIKTSAR